MEPAMDVFIPLNAAVLLSSFLCDGLVAWIGGAEEAVTLEITDRGQRDVQTGLEIRKRGHLDTRTVPIFFTCKQETFSVEGT
jgi:hypothetical protein